MSNFNSNYKLEPNLYMNSSGINSSSNFYDRKVKEGIPIFQEIGTFNNTINNHNYVDPFKLLENNKNENFLNKENGGSVGLGGGAYSLNMTDIETRKMIEREMNPYISKMKNELNILFDKFRKEMEDKSNILNEISLLKEQSEQNNQNNIENFTNIEKKILNIKDKLIYQDKKMNDFQNEFNKINQMNQIMNKKTDDLYDNLNNFENIKNKILSLDASNEKVYKDLYNNIEKMTNDKMEELSKKINLLKNDNINLHNDILNNKNKIDMLNLDNDKKIKKINELENYIQDLTNKINNLNLNNNKNLNLINNFEIKNYEFEQKMKLINDKLLSIDSNLNSTFIDIKSNKQSINSNKQII